MNFNRTASGGMVMGMFRQLILLGSVLFAMGAGALGTREAAKSIRLDPKDLREILLRQGPKVREVTLQYEQERLAPVRAMMPFDWKVNLASGYQLDKSQQFSPPSIVGASFRQWITNGSLAKSFTTGSVLGIDFTHLRQTAAYGRIVPVSSITGQPVAFGLTQDLFGVSLEQSLLSNAFGRADRANLRAAEKSYAAATENQAGALQQVVLEATLAYWDALVAEETHQASRAARERYKDLVARIKLKSSLGSASPAELVQVQAEFESQDQAERRTAAEAAGKMDVLKTLLGFEPETRLAFAVDSKVPPPPASSPVEVESLRAVRAQKMRVEAAENGLTASRSLRYPAVNFVGRLYSSGFGTTAGGSWSDASSGRFPKFYAGLKMTYNFGSGLQDEDIHNKLATRELEETRWRRQKQEQADALAQTDRRVQASYAVVQSATKQIEFRQKAVKELSRAHAQGRVDIKVLIDAINNQVATEVQLYQAVGAYHTALTEWAATRDQLVPSLP